MMDIKQHFLISVCIMVFAGLIISAKVYCPDDQICNCTPESIKCICLQRQNIIFQKGEAFNGKEIIVKGCGDVKLEMSFAKNLLTESFLISDLLKLHIAQFAFQRSSITKLHINNIREVSLEPFGLSRIKNVINLKIDNVFLELLPHFAIWNTETQNVAFTNSHIGTIQDGAIQVNNMESFLMDGNTIDDLSGSIEISNIKKFSFTRNVVKNAGFYSISLFMAEKVEIGYCNFHKINPNMIYTRNVEKFSFHDNYIDICKEKAFWDVQATTEVYFVNNQIVSANIDSLIPNLAPNVIDLSIIKSFNNTFVCDCNIEWLLSTNNPSYEFIKERSVCYDPPHLSDLMLSQLKLSLNHTGTCVSIEKLSTTDVTASSAIPSIAKQKFSLETIIRSPKSKISRNPKAVMSIRPKVNALTDPETDISRSQMSKASAILKTDISKRPKIEKSMSSETDASENSKPKQSETEETENQKTEITTSPKTEETENQKTEITTSPKEETTTSPKGETTTTPKEEITTSPKEETTTSPKGEATTTPKGETTTTPKEETTTSPKGEATTTPKGETTTSPKGETTTTPKEEITTSPKGEATTTPKGETTTTPKEETTTSPKEEATTTPKGETTTTPKGETTTTPKEETTTSPKSETTTSPKRETTTPNGETTTTPKGGTTTSPKGETTTSPKRETTNPKGETTTTPKGETTTSPKAETTTSPKVESSSSANTTTVTPTNSFAEMYISNSVLLSSVSFLVIWWL